MATHASALSGFSRYLPGGRWLVVGLAFLLGWLLFGLVWLADRGDDDAAEAPVKPAASAETFEPLPRPMAAGDAATPLPVPAEEESETAQLVEEEPAIVEPVPAPVETTPLPPSLEETAAPVAVAAQPPAPLPDQSPSPRYPIAAARRGESGTVVLEVEVDAGGTPLSVEVASRSGSRDLDRAAVDAVSRWRFSPALDADGNPVPGRLTVPIDFKME